MSHSLLFYPNPSVTWMDFCTSGGKNTKEGNFLAFSCTGSPSCCPGQGTDTPRTQTSLAGVCAWFTLTCSLALEVLPTPWWPCARCLSLAGLLIPEVPRAASPSELCWLHQPPVPVLHRDTATCIPQRHHLPRP